MTGLIIVLCVIGLVYWLWSSEPSGRNRSRDFNRIHGRHRVLYNDGKLSEPMCKDVAKDYASIFGGKVIPR